MTFQANLQRHIHRLCRSPRTPHSTGYYEAQKYIAHELQKIGYEVKNHNFFNFPVGQCRNIYVEAGANQGKRILVGAHYESRACSGIAADDNASGVAINLELARHFYTQKIPLTFVFFDIEENFGWGGLKGSKAFSRFYRESLEKVVIFDLVGGVLAPDFEKTYMQFGSALKTLEHPKLEFLHIPEKVLEPFGKRGARSDYDAFRRKGVPYTFISSGTPWYYHTTFDRPERLQFSKMSNLLETIIASLKTRHTTETTIPWNDFYSFLHKLHQTQELRCLILSRLLAKAHDPTALEIALMYWQILSRIKRFGPKLWEKVAG